MENDNNVNIGIQLQGNQSMMVLPDQGNVIFNKIINDQSNNISYDSTTGVITLLEPGEYYLEWNVGIFTQYNKSVLKLMSISGDNVSIYSAQTFGNLVGNALLTITQQTQLVIRNLSGKNITYCPGTITSTLTILELNAIQGEAGPTGDKGETGDKGLTGDKGSTGDKGETGDKGTTGDTQGPTGDKGEAGDKGPTGVNGEIGDKGLTGDKGASGNLKGETGDEGPTGDKGLTGDKGETGDKGASGDKGLTGDKGVTGDKGAIGSTGATGSKGLTGDKGVTGGKGATGATGATGVTGATGAKGTTGATGVTGDKGATGINGVVNNQIIVIGVYSPYMIGINSESATTIPLDKITCSTTLLGSVDPYTIDVDLETPNLIFSGGGVNITNFTEGYYELTYSIQLSQPTDKSLTFNLTLKQSDGMPKASYSVYTDEVNSIISGREMIYLTSTDIKNSQGKYIFTISCQSPEGMTAINIKKIEIMIRA